MNYKHGFRHTKIYKAWSGIKSRCFNKNDHSFNHYGGRGITMCDEWKNNFKSFYNWAINNGYKKDLSIDRINNNGNYEPNNCRWITIKEQCNNRRSNKFITYKNETHTIAEWSEITGIKYKCLYKRIKYFNWNIDKAFNTPIK